MKASEIQTNVVFAVSLILNFHLPKIKLSGWDNLSSINLKTGKSVSLPLFSQIIHKEEIGKDDIVDEKSARLIQKITKSRALRKRRLEKIKLKESRTKRIKSN